MFRDPQRCPRRRRLWELDRASVTAVLRVCFTAEDLRHLLACNGQSGLLRNGDDLYRLAARLCGEPTSLAVYLQHRLGARYNLTVQHSKTASSPGELGALWRNAVRDGEIAGVLWATLCHSACTRALRKRMLQVVRDVHGPMTLADRCLLGLTRYCRLVGECALHWAGLRRADIRPSRASCTPVETSVAGSDAGESAHARVAAGLAGAAHEPVSGAAGALQRAMTDKRNLSLARAAAEALICRTACIRHGGYWRDSEQCRRTGMPCVHDGDAAVARDVEAREIRARETSCSSD